MAEPFLVAVMGETASGKTDLAEAIAGRLQARLINADSFQVYRGMDIGTAKSARKAEYALMDICDPSEQFGVGAWVQLAAAELQTAYKGNQHSVVVGGSGLNIRALFEGFSDMSGPPDPGVRQELNARFETHGLQPLVDELVERSGGATTIDLKNPIRVIRALEKLLQSKDRVSFQVPPFRKVKFQIATDPEEVSQRIGARVETMIENGWLNEVEQLMQQGYLADAPGFRAHGYREMRRVLEGDLELGEAKDSVVAQVRRYAKRQRTWLRTEPNVTVLQTGSGIDLAELANGQLAPIGE